MEEPSHSLTGFRQCHFIGLVSFFVLPTKPQGPHGMHRCNPTNLERNSGKGLLDVAQSVIFGDRDRDRARARPDTD